MDKRFTPEELNKAEEKIAKLEESGFFFLCRCSMGQPECPLAVSAPEEPQSH